MSADPITITPADLTVEVVSGSNSAVEVVIKIGEYFRAGVRHLIED